MFSRDTVVNAAKELLDADRSPSSVNTSSVTTAAEKILKTEITTAGTLTVSSCVDAAKPILKAEISGGSVVDSNVSAVAQKILKTEIIAEGTDILPAAVTAAKDILKTEISSGSVVSSTVIADAKKVLGDLGTSYGTSVTATSIAREIIGDTVSPYRWSDASLTSYENAGKIEVQKLHPELSSVGAEFNGALAHYIASLAFASDNDAQANNNNLSSFHYKQFSEMAQIAPSKWGSQLESFVSTGITEIKKLHPELSSDVPAFYTAALVNYVVAQGLKALNRNSDNGQSLQYMNLFETLAAAGPFFWDSTTVSTKLTQFGNVAIGEIKKLHPEMLSQTNIPYCYSAAVINYIVANGLQIANNGNDDARSTKYFQLYSEMAANGPYFWESNSTIIASLISTGKTEILKHHPNLTTVPKCYENALVNYVVAQGLQISNHGNDDARSTKYFQLFSEQSANGPYFWESGSDTKLTAFGNAAVDDIKAKHPELLSATNIPQCYSAAVINYIVANGLQIANNGNDDARSTKYFQLYSEMAANGPYFWTSSDVANYVNDGITEIKKLHPEITGSTISEDYTTALINYAVYRGLAVSNIGNDDARSSKYLQLFNEMAMAAPYCWQGIDLTKLADDAAATVSSMRPDLRISSTGTLKTIRVVSGNTVNYDLPDAWSNSFAYFIASRAGLRSKLPETNAYYEKFKEDMMSL